MGWWVLTFLENDREFHSLYVLAGTSQKTHLMMAWSTVEPARSPVYRTVRGKRIFCGWKYIWDTPNLTEQRQAGTTYDHIFGPIALQPTDHVWYLLASPGIAPGTFCQSPLIHVPPPEIEMASARIFNSLDQPIPTNAITPISFDSVLWDDYNFYDPAEPTKFTIPAGALYQIGGCVRIATDFSPGARVFIFLNTANALIMHSHRQQGLDWTGAAFSLNTLMRLQPADFLQLCVFHIHGHAVNVLALDHFSPHFWVRLVGAYPP